MGVRKALSVWCLLVATMPMAVAIPSAAEVEQVALEYVRSSQNYVENAGFGERVLNVSFGEEVSRVIIEYQTRHVGMLQIIGHFVCYLAIETETLKVMDSAIEETYEQAEPGDPGNATDPDPDPDSGDPDEGYRLKISYTINMTLALIYENEAEHELAEALNMLQRAQELLERGEYDPALELALDANALATEHIQGGSGSGEEPGSTEPGSDMPWLQGYIVVFDHEPVQEDWDRLQTMYNATYIGEAGGYTEEKNAYWVKVHGTDPSDLLLTEGVKDVIVLRGGPDEAGEDQTEVPEVLGPSILLSVGLLASRRLGTQS